MSTAEIPSLLSTADELPRISSELALQGKRCQLLDGELQIMSPSGGFHGALAADVTSLLSLYVKQNGLGRCFGSETGFQLSSQPDTVMAPDVAFVRKERLDAVGLSESYFPEAPALAVEIVSPGDTADEVDDKARRWLAAGAESVWVVYPKRHTVTIYRSAEDVKLLSADDTLTGENIIPGFSVKVAELFAGLNP